MTTPTEPNGMSYPATPVIVAATSLIAAKDELIQYGIDYDASASYITVVASADDISNLTVDSRKWAVAGTISAPLRQMMYARFGEAVLMPTLLAVNNNDNVILRSSRGTAR